MLAERPCSRKGGWILKGRIALLPWGQDVGLLWGQHPWKSSGDEPAPSPTQPWRRKRAKK